MVNHRCALYIGWSSYTVIVIKLDTCLYELIYWEKSILPPSKIFTIPPETPCIYVGIIFKCCWSEVGGFVLWCTVECLFMCVEQKMKVVVQELLIGMFQLNWSSCHTGCKGKKWRVDWILVLYVCFYVKQMINCWRDDFDL